MDEVILSRITKEAYEKGYADGKVDGYNLAGKALSQQRKKGKWIQVTERLPEYGIDVLTVDGYGDYEINHIIDEEDGEWYWEPVPTAWMALPEWKGEEE